MTKKVISGLFVVALLTGCCNTGCNKPAPCEKPAPVPCCETPKPCCN